MLLRLFPNCNTHRSGQFIQLAAQGYAAMTGAIHWRYNSDALQSEQPWQRTKPPLPCWEQR